MPASARRSRSTLLRRDGDDNGLSSSSASSSDGGDKHDSGALLREMRAGSRSRRRDVPFSPVASLPAANTHPVRSTSLHERRPLRKVRRGKLKKGRKREERDLGWDSTTTTSSSSSSDGELPRPKEEQRRRRKKAHTRRHSSFLAKGASLRRGHRKSESAAETLRDLKKSKAADSQKRPRPRQRGRAHKTLPKETKSSFVPETSADAPAQKNPRDTFFHRLLKACFFATMILIMAGTLTIGTLSVTFYSNRFSADLRDAVLPALISGTPGTVDAGIVCDADSNLPLRFALGCPSRRAWLGLTLLSFLPVCFTFLVAFIQRQVYHANGTSGSSPKISMLAVVLVAFGGAAIEAVASVLFFLQVVPNMRAFDMIALVGVGFPIFPLLVQIIASARAYRATGTFLQQLWEMVVQILSLVTCVIATMLILFSQDPSVWPAVIISTLFFSLSYWRACEHLLTAVARACIQEFHYKEVMIRSAIKLMLIPALSYLLARAALGLDDPFPDFGETDPLNVTLDVKIDGEIQSVQILAPSASLTLARSRNWDILPAIFAVLASFLSMRAGTQLLRATNAYGFSAATVIGVVLPMVLVNFAALGIPDTFVDVVGEFGEWRSVSSVNIDDGELVYDVEPAVLVAAVLFVVIFCVILRVWRTIPSWRVNQSDQELWHCPGFEVGGTGVVLALSRNYFELLKGDSGPVTSSQVITNPRDHFTFIVGALFRESENEMRGLLQSAFDHVRGLSKAQSGRYRMFVAFDNAFEKQENPDLKVHDSYPQDLNEFAVRFLDILRDMMGEQADLITFYLRTDIRAICMDVPVPGRFPSDPPMIFTCVFKNPHTCRRGKRFSQSLLFSMILDEVSANPELLKRLNSTYILTVDGDSTFTTDGVDLLRHVLQQDPFTTGAACGRIIPKGEDLPGIASRLAFIQKFEYAAGHWLGKTAETFFGTVLCAPGCWSMLRLSSFLRVCSTKKTNSPRESILEKFANHAKNPIQALTFDQGEDRLLTALLIKNGWRVQYSASSKAYTACPTTLPELFHQRRRWISSTLANLLQLLSWRKEIIRENANVSSLFMFYVALMVVVSILSPASIALVSQGALVYAFNFPAWLSSVVALALPLAMIAVSVLWRYDVTKDGPSIREVKVRIQLNLAYTLTFLYALVMCAVIVGLTIRIAADFRENSLAESPDTWFFLTLIAMFMVSGLVHFEIVTLLAGFGYLLVLPMMHMLLVVFAVANLQDLRWGTREGDTKNTLARSAFEVGWFSTKIGSSLKKVHEFLSPNERLHRKYPDEEVSSSDDEQRPVQTANSGESSLADLFGHAEPMTLADFDDFVESKEDALETAWEKLHVLECGEGKVAESPAAFAARFDTAQSMYLKALAVVIRAKTIPVLLDEDTVGQHATELQALSRNVAGAFLAASGVWIVLTLAFALHSDLSVANSNIIGLVFLIVFACILVIQFLAMLAHRWKTLVETVALTPARSSKPRKPLNLLVRGTSYYPLYSDLEQEDQDAFDFVRIEPHQNQSPIRLP